MIWKLAIEKNVAPNFLEFIGVMDASLIGKMLYMFNILDPTHEAYRSTIAFQVICDAEKVKKS